MIGFIVAGLIIGALARLLIPGRQKIGFLWTLLLGLAGSVIGGSIANLIGTGDIMELNVIGFIVAVLSAVALLVVAERATANALPAARADPGLVVHVLADSRALRLVDGLAELADVRHRGRVRPVPRPVAEDDQAFLHLGLLGRGTDSSELQALMGCPDVDFSTILD